MALGPMELLIIVVLAFVLFGGGLGVGVVLAASSLRRRQNAISNDTLEAAPRPVASQSAAGASVAGLPQAVIAPPEQLDTTLIHDDKRFEIGRALADGKKIQAIKVYREATSLGLKEAKDAVEYWDRYGQRELREEGGTGGQWPTMPR